MHGGIASIMNERVACMLDVGIALIMESELTLVRELGISWWGKRCMRHACSLPVEQLNIYIYIRIGIVRCGNRRYAIVDMP